MTAPLRLSVSRHDVPVPESARTALRISVRLPSDLLVIEEAVDIVARHCLAEGLSPRQAPPDRAARWASTTRMSPVHLSPRTQSLRTPW